MNVQNELEYRVKKLNEMYKMRKLFPIGCKQYNDYQEIIDRLHREIEDLRNV